MHAPPLTREPTPALVIIGHGMAAQKLLEQLVSLSPDQQLPWPVTVIGEEPHLPYNRIQLSPLLAGETRTEGLISQQADWFSRHGITRISGDPVSQIDRAARCVETASGGRIPYQRLVIATGSRPALPLPLPAHLPESSSANDWPPGLMGFRDLKDVEQMQAACLAGRREGAGALVIGGGLLGLEAAEGLRKGGLEVTLLQRSERLMNRQLDEVAAGLLEQELRERGLDIITGAHLEEWLETPAGRITGVRLKDGRELHAGLTIAATGIRPEIELAHAAGLACQRAIQVDGHLLTSDPHIHALGECCEVDGETFGLIEPIWAQIEVLARQLLAQPTPPYRNAPLATRLKVSGIDLYSCGELAPRPNDEVLVYQDHALGDYRRLLLREERLVGVVLYGDVSAGNALFEALKAGIPLTRIREDLLLMPAEALARLTQDGPPTAPDDPSGKPGTQDTYSDKTDNTPDTFEEAA
ncbi:MULTISPECIES: NAD(P)/FAD-dependent oxidoreductase [unclassified Cobetia]|uniref:NAD(P)/FAD-dependent oxidoreductase n=1 Tax=unclassified Cobetia TaxID=2609414 RepID=UPI002097C183|nr:MULTISPECIES: FAD-dependent oxidoreductase [unclassified Cobetia]MCO7233243.1 FAD-dependent oxidoreductase [Cobetia sp. Dlab-2-AX]MCO7236693.1 FAD-dependent oxidoreductase [Cobetia sp. Dlab-2-U]